MVDRRRIRRLWVKRLQPLQQPDAMKVAPIDRNISAAIANRLLETPGSGFFCAQSLFVDPAHVGVTKTPVERDRCLDVAHVNPDIGHPQNMRLLPARRRPGYRALFKLQVDTVRVTHENKAITRRPVGFTQKCHALTAQQRDICHEVCRHERGVSHTKMIRLAVWRLRIKRDTPLQ